MSRRTRLHTYSYKEAPSFLGTKLAWIEKQKSGAQDSPSDQHGNGTLGIAMPVTASAESREYNQYDSGDQKTIDSAPMVCQIATFKSSARWTAYAINNFHNVQEELTDNNAHEDDGRQITNGGRFRIDISILES